MEATLSGNKATFDNMFTMVGAISVHDRYKKKRRQTVKSPPECIYAIKAVFEINSKVRKELLSFVRSS
jgi:hypothetical protein